MKRSLIITLTGIMLLTIPGTIFSQDTITIYFNKKWVECKKNRATYYRKYYETEDNTYHVCDYNTSGQLQMTGTFQNQDWESKTGLFTYYYPNGQKKSETYYIENKENGVSTQWYDNGNKKYEVVYVDGKREGPSFNWHENGNIRASVEYKDGDYSGLTTEYDKDGKLLYKYVGNLDLLDNKAEFEAALTDYKDFLIQRIHYPDQAKIEGQQGRIWINFIIEENGIVFKAEILQGVSEDLDNEAIRVTKSYRWPKPRYKGNETYVSFNTSLKFGLGN